MINWIRNIDTRKVTAAFAALTTIEMLIASGQISLDGAVPGAWVPFIVKWCGIFVVINQVLNVGHVVTAAKWPTPAAPSGFNAKAVIAFLAIGAAIAMGSSVSPAHAAVRHHRIAALIPMPPADPRLPANSTPDAGTTPPAATVKQNILNTAPADIAYAIQLATQANTPQSNVRKMCYQAIGALIPTTPTGTLPPGPDVVTHIEQGAELLDGLQPNSPVFVNCAGAAALAGQNVLAFVNAVVTGIAGIAIVAPKLP